MKNVKENLFKKLSKYVKIHSPSNGANADKTPSTPYQTAFAKILAKDLKDAGVKNVTITTHSYVLGEIPATTKKKMPSVAFLAHMDTVSDFTAQQTKPVLHKNYKGGKIIINAKKKMELNPVKDPDLKLCKGHDIVTSDGNTILGADDKSGISIIMEMAEYFKNNPKAEHGPIKICFTVDEEIGHGSALLPLDKLKADFAYTIDGESMDGICIGNFNADAAVIKITGVNTHPGSAKGVMKNPVMVASDLITSWRKDSLPETTDKEKGFILFNGISGSLEEVTIKAIVREHDLKKLAQLEKELLALAKKMEAKYKGAKITIAFTEQYRNMKDILKKNPAALTLLEKKLKQQKIKYVRRQARGGTDGARLSFRGLVTPDIMACYGNAHGPSEWASLDHMAKVLKLVIAIVTPD